MPGLSGRPRVLVCAAAASPIHALLADSELELEAIEPRDASPGGASLDALIISDDASPARAEVARAMAGECVPVLFVDQAGDGRARAEALARGAGDAIGPPLVAAEIEHRIAALCKQTREREAMTRANQTLRELAEKKRILAALVVHDLRNPLTAIQGNLQLVREIIEVVDPVALRALRDLEDLTTHTLTLVANLLDVDELEEGLLSAKIESVDVCELLATTSRHQRAVIEFRQLSLDCDVPAGLRADFDPSLVGRVVENLIDNAVRYAPRGGLVAVRACPSADGLAIRVLNSGPAIDHERRAAIFERFFQVEARREGARANRGLGLYFCKLAAQAHGGSIAVIDGERGLPACFELFLPSASSATRSGARS